MIDRNFNDSNPLLTLWNNWQGAIDCYYSKKIWTSHELQHISSAFADYLISKGLKECDLVIIAMTNTAAFPVALMALLYVGCNPFLLNASVPQAELERLEKQFNVKYLIHDYIDGVSRFDNHQNRETFFVGNVPVGVTALTNQHGDRYNSKKKGILFHPTSGTYGRSKYCIRSQKAAVHEGINITSSIDIYKSITITVTTPLHHAFSFGFGLVSSLLTQSTLILYPSFNPRILLKKLKIAQGDILTVVPPMLGTLITMAEESSYKMPKAVFFSGAPCKESSIINFQKTFNTRLYQMYGTTETGAITTSYSRDDIINAVGRPLKNMDVKICNCEKYTDMGQGIGEIHIKSSAMMDDYTHGNIEIPEYWNSNDIGFFDERNNLHLVGRIKDIINVGGNKVDPKEVEEVLMKYPGIIDAVVYPGIVNDEKEFVQAAMCTNTEINSRELNIFCFKNLVDYKIPVKFHVVNNIPRTPSGKCLKVNLPDYPETFICK
jgi:long-chain acyl-CoA synthetase